MTNTETPATISLPRSPDHRASSEAFRDHARIVGEMICSARAMTRIIGEGQPELIVARRSWPPNTDQQMGVREALERGDIDRFFELVGLPSSVDLTADGRVIDSSRFCLHVDVPFETWVYAERWEPNGRISHGFVHATCRAWTQTG